VDDGLITGLFQGCKVRARCDLVALGLVGGLLTQRTPHDGLKRISTSSPPATP